MNCIPGGYDLDDFERKAAKVGFNTVLNAGTRRSGTGAIARYLEPPVEEGGAAMGAKPSEASFERARKLVAAIESKHRKVAHRFFRDAGVGLQLRDAEILADTVEHCMADDISALTVHDSCRAPVVDIERVREHMAAAFMRHTGLSCSVAIN